MNQMLIVGVVALLAIAMLGESYRASRAADIYPPALTRLYFAVGPAGLALAGLMSIAASFAVIGVRRRFAAIVLTSVSFFTCIAFLGGAIFASILPLLVAIRDSLPPEGRW